MSNAHGICACGCGQKTRLAPVNDRSKGWVKGAPLVFIKGHGFRLAKKGADAPRWNGGKHKSTGGYTVLWTPDGRKYEHVAIAEAALGRQLKHISHGHALNEVVHHIDGNKRNNSASNLLICTNAYHLELHARLEASADWPMFKPRLKHPRGTSRIGAAGFKGVRRSKGGDRWKSEIEIEGKKRSLGIFDTAADAARAYDAAVLANFPSGWITNKSMGLLA